MLSKQQCPVGHEQHLREFEGIPPLPEVTWKGCFLFAGETQCFAASLPSNSRDEHVAFSPRFNLEEAPRGNQTGSWLLGEGGSIPPPGSFSSRYPCVISPPSFSQEQEKEARNRAAYIAALPKSPLWWRDFDRDKDDDSSSGGCSPAAGGGGSSSFHGLVF